MSEASVVQQSPFHLARAGYRPRSPQATAQLSALRARFEPRPADVPAWCADPAAAAALKAQFPHTWPQVAQGRLCLGEGAPAQEVAGHRVAHRVGVVFSGGPAPGGHNVLWGLHDALITASDETALIGFVGGPAGILANRFQMLNAASLAPYCNTGGFDLLGTGRTKIESDAQFATCYEVAARHQLDALVIIGGDDSNTNAARLAEYFLARGSKLSVIGVPKTIDGDLKNAQIETTFGFDTAVRLYCELVSNIARDSLSGRKLYHFVRLMGRNASHITLEVALQTQPTVALIAEEIAAKGWTLRQVADHIAQVIKERAQRGQHYGVVLVPEGLVEFIPEMRSLILELNRILGEHHDYMASLSGFTEQSEYIHRKLTRDASYTFTNLPLAIQRQLLMDRDPHGNVALSRIETEELLIDLVKSLLGEEQEAGNYSGGCGFQHHFLGYEGRCADPTNFDADYAYSLGRCAVALACLGATGYMAVVRHLAAGVQRWQAAGVPLLAMMTLEPRRGKLEPVIRKGLVDLSGAAFRYLTDHRQAWSERERSRFTGPIQYFGPPELTDCVPRSLALEHGLAGDPHL